MRIRVIHFFLSLLLSALPLTAPAQDTFGLNTGNNAPLVRSSVLPVEEAFAFNAFIEAPDTVVLLWEIQAGYYLYRKSISLDIGQQQEQVDIGELPAGETHTDEFFGEVQIYRDRLVHRFPLANLEPEGMAASFRLHFQGCAQDKYCYPMQDEGIVLMLPK